MMDTSEKYIKMCEKAEEIQRKASLFPGDVWYHPELEVGLCHYNYPCWSCDAGVEKVFWFDGYGIRLVDKLGSMIWLPRQDQLQEIIGFSVFEQYNHNFWWWAETKTNLIEDAESWEQLWLAFVMHEKYGKVWDDQKAEWISQVLPDKPEKREG